MSREKENICSPTKKQKQVLIQQSVLKEQSSQKHQRHPLEQISEQQRQYLDEEPIVMKTHTSRLNTIESKVSRARLRTHSRQFSSSGLSKFLEENKHYKQKSLIPGPGSYETCLLRKTIKGGAFYKGSQYPSANNIAPGPGSYQPNKLSGGRKGFSVGRSLRKLDQQNLENPGPASYQIPEPSRLKSKTPRVVFPKATINHDASLTPGPGTYNSSHSTLSRRSALIKGRNRFQIKTNVAPSPMDYHPNYEVASRRCSALYVSCYSAFQNQESVITE